jgi:hypothetical protein
MTGILRNHKELFEIRQPHKTASYTGRTGIQTQPQRIEEKPSHKRNIEKQRRYDIRQPAKRSLFWMWCLAQHHKLKNFWAGNPGCALRSD